MSVSVNNVREKTQFVVNSPLVGRTTGRREVVVGKVKGRDR